MEIKLLLPHKYKSAGVLMALSGILLYFLRDLTEHILTIDLKSLGIKVIGKYAGDKIDFTTTLMLLFLITGGVMVAFSKEKIEDEFIYRLRLTSWLWAILINYILLFISTALIYGLNYLDILIYNMFTPLLLFILIFNGHRLAYARKKKDEE